MARYTYRHAIEHNDFPDLSDRDWAIVAAAFEVAAEAHKHQSRYKIDPMVKYISHPIMVADILWRLGERDPLGLAAALLHDTIEDNPEFRQHPHKLKLALIKVLEKHGLNKEHLPHYGPPDPATKFAARIYTLCKEVTNPQVYGGDGSKEGEQIDRVSVMSFDAKRLKLCDQAASLVCNLTMANNPEEFKPEQEVKFSEKAHALAVRIFQSVQKEPAERDNLKPYASFFGKAILNVFPLLASQDEVQKGAVREKFDFDRLINSEEYVNILPDEVVVLEKLPISNLKHAGLTWVEFDAQGNVVRYALWTNWNAPQGEANAVQKNLTEQIRAMRRIDGKYMKGDPVRALLMPSIVQRVTTDDGLQLAGIERVFDLSPPLYGGAFAVAAGRVKAVDFPGQKLIESVSKRLEVAYKQANAPEIVKSPTYGNWSIG